MESVADDRGVRVRAAVVDDLPAVADLRWRWDAGDEGTGEARDRAGFRRMFLAWIDGHRSTHLPFVATVDGRVCGMAWLMLAERVPSVKRPERPTGDLQSVYVVPEHRDRGVGAALVAAVLDEARRRGLHHVTVHAAERAVPFYERAGFAAYRSWHEWTPEAG